MNRYIAGGASAALVFSVVSVLIMTKRIHRLENGASETLDLIKLHLEKQHGITKATATNSTSITISNASEKTITVTFPSPLQAKEDKP